MAIWLKTAIFPLEPSDYVWASGARQKYVQFLDHFLKDKAVVPICPCLSYSWPKTAAVADFTSEIEATCLR